MVTMKICSKCKVEEYDDSIRKSKSNTWCKSCHKLYKIENKEKLSKQRLQYRQEHRDELNEKSKEYIQLNEEKVRERRKLHYLNNKERIKTYTRKYYSEHIDHYKEYNTNYFKNRRNSDPVFKLRGRVSTFIRASLKRNGGTKDSSIKTRLPYSILELKEHLEKQFEPWMTWENHGKYDAKIWKDDAQSTWTWQIDHIVPQSTFQYTSMEDQAFQDCWALANLRPLSAKRNYLDGVRRTRHEL